MYKPLGLPALIVAHCVLMSPAIADNKIGGTVLKPLNPSMGGIAQDMVAAIRTACPTDSNKCLEESAYGPSPSVTVTSLTPEKKKGTSDAEDAGSGPKKESHIIQGDHDHDTVAVNPLADPVTIGVSLMHELQHAKNASAAGTDQDPSTQPNPTSAGCSFASQYTHSLMHQNDLANVCKISSNAGMPIDTYPPNGPGDPIPPGGPTFPPINCEQHLKPVQKSLICGPLGDFFDEERFTKLLNATKALSGCDEDPPLDPAGCDKLDGLMPLSPAIPSNCGTPL